MDSGVQKEKEKEEERNRESEREMRDEMGLRGIEWRGKNNTGLLFKKKNRFLLSFI